MVVINGQGGGGSPCRCQVARKAERRGRIAGLVILVLVVIGLVWIGWWVLNHKDGRRFRGIEKFRSELCVVDPSIQVELRFEACSVGILDWSMKFDLHLQDPRECTRTK